MGHAPLLDGTLAAGKLQMVGSVARVMRREKRTARW